MSRRVVQEPGFTQLDREFCAGLGLDAVDSPDAFSLIDTNTMVFAIHMELQTYQQALATLPAVFIGASRDELEKLADFNPDLPAINPIREMDASYDRYLFPDLDYMFHGTAMYWRRSDEAADSSTIDTSRVN